MIEFMTAQLYWIVPLWTFTAGLVCGAMGANRRWRQHGDNEHGIRIVSAGHYYEVNRIS